MFEVKCTGKNLNYGKEDEIRLLNDAHVLPAVKNGWVEVIKYAGSGEAHSLFSLKRRLLSVQQNIKLMKMKETILKEEINKIERVKK